MQIDEEKIRDALVKSVGHLGITKKSGIDFQRLMTILIEVERQREENIIQSKDVGEKDE